MARITEADYTKLAEAVSTDLIESQVPLNESISKLAGQMDMSQEQIQRLCETTNNLTFNKMFKARDKTANDRMIEFDVADANQILGDAVKEAQISLDANTVVHLRDYAPLADDVIDDEPVEKTASFELRPEAKPNSEKDRRTLRKTLDHLRHQKIATELVYADALQNLSARFRRLYKDMTVEEFEKNAAAIYGESAETPLNDLRGRLRMPEVVYDFTTLVKQASYIDDSALEFKLFSNALQASDKLTGIKAGINKLESML